MIKINIAIDGHSSCGKSTMAKALAKRIGYTYIDTGAMYRGVTLFSMKRELWEGEKPLVDKIVAALPELTLSFESSEDTNRLVMNGTIVEDEIRSMAVANKVSPISAIPEVRAFLVRQQQEIAKDKGIVMDGRDIGTVVLPDAELKIFVTASPEVRAKRRFIELEKKGDKTSYEEVYKNVTTRDHIDSTRATSPLRQADDARLLDNSDLTLQQQDDLVYQWYCETISKLKDL